ncbi:MAG: hypothetical protein EOP00_19195 [Pedobacter sp.]|nr:MAG: hypothetical protein EOP00_19195 [Pedobacter sp.]
MTKYLTIALLLFANITFAQSEKYYVTFIKGQAKIKKTSKLIKIGDILLPTDAILFKDQTGKVSCISPGKGRFDITAQKTKLSPSGELLAVLKSNLLPATTTYHLSTRSLTFDGYDPKAYFQSPATNNRILLISNETLPIIPSYKLDQQNFFFIQYTLNGKLITKKIDQNEKGLVFNPLLFNDDPQTNVMLCYQYMVAGEPKSISIAEFIPVTVNKDDLFRELKIIKAHIGDNKKILKEAVTAHIFDNYGKLGQDQIDKMIL